MQVLLALALSAGAPALAQTSYGADRDQPALVSDWRVEQETRGKALANYLGQKPIAYRWFTDVPFGLTSGAPYIVLKLLPRIAPEQWGSNDNFLDVVGLFNDERNAGYRSLGALDGRVWPATISVEQSTSPPSAAAPATSAESGWMTAAFVTWMAASIRSSISSSIASEWSTPLRK